MEKILAKERKDNLTYVMAHWIVRMFLDNT